MLRRPLASPGALRASRSPLQARRAGDVVSRKSYATAPSPAGAPLPIPPPPPPRPRKSIPRRILTPIFAATLLFYGASVPLGFLSLRYRDFLVETVPFGEQLGDLLDKYELSGSGGVKVDEAGKPIVGAGGKPGGKETELTRYAESRARAEGWGLKKGEKPDPTKVRAEKEKKQAELSSKAAEALEAAKAKAGAKAQEGKALAEKAAAKVVEVATIAKEAVIAAPEPIEPVAPKSTVPAEYQRPRQLDATPIPQEQAHNEIYNGPP
ncbi:hypothetical protein P7C70_g5847, partial [Phenoliferia sp. Uapishka_3]